MRTKVVDKGKKRSLSETSVSIKSNQKQKNIDEFKKGPKKAKFADVKQNGNPTLGGKAPIFKIVDKQKKEENKIIKQQSNTVKPLEIKKDTKEKKELTVVKSEKETIGRTNRLRRRRPYNSLNLTVEQMTKKIAEIQSREVLSKRAKKILGTLNRKLRECGNKSEKLDTVGKKSNKKMEHANALMKNRQKTNDEDKTKVEKKHVQSKAKLQEEDDDDSDVEEDEDDSNVEEESEEESDESKTENELVKIQINKREEVDDESEDEDEEMVESEEDEEEIDSEEGEEEVDSKEAEAADSEDSDDYEDEEDEEDESLENQLKGELKKKKYVLFVGNLPLNITETEILRHFITKLGMLRITNVKLPKKPDKTPYGFAYLNVTNKIDFEKGLSLNHSFLKKKRINVQHSIPGGEMADEKLILAKNMKLQALQKAGKLAGGNQKKKPFKKEK